MSSPLYLAAWRTLVGLVIVVGLVLACTSLDGSVLVAVALYTGLIGLAIPDFVRPGAGGPREQRAGSDLPLEQPVRRRLGSAALTAMGTVALLGLLAAVGVGAVALVALLVAGWPPVLAWCRSAQPPPREDAAPLAAPRAAAPSSRQAATHTGGRVPAEMTFDELCRAWRASYPDLRQCVDLRRQAQSVEARQSYLDELERRDPVAFALWLRSGARAASDPSNFSAH